MLHYRRDSPQGMEIPWGVGLLTSTAGIPPQTGLLGQVHRRECYYLPPKANKLNIQLNFTSKGVTPPLAPYCLASQTAVGHVP